MRTAGKQSSEAIFEDFGIYANCLSWRRLFILVQKAHFKSTSMGKLASAVDVYACLGRQISIRTEVLKKLSSFLTHPFPRVGS